MEKYFARNQFYFLHKSKITGIPSSSFYKLGRLLYEESNVKEKENLYDSSISFMKPGSDRLNSSFCFDGVDVKFEIDFVTPLSHIKVRTNNGSQTLFSMVQETI